MEDIDKLKTELKEEIDKLMECLEVDLLGKSNLSLNDLIRLNFLLIDAQLILKDENIEEMLDSLNKLKLIKL